MGERASRIDTILRWVSAKKVAMTEALPGHKLYDPACRVEIAYVNKVAAASAYIDQNYPTEQYVAAIGLAISIMVGFDGVAPANPPDRPKSESAKQVAASVAARRAQGTF